MDHREMLRLARDPDAVRRTAAYIRAIAADTLNESSREFLSRLETYDGAKPLSIRQLELLDALQEQSWRRRVAGGYRASRLVARCLEQRLDLEDDEDAIWLEALREQGPEMALSRPQWRRLIAICKALGVLEANTWIEL